jgi:putative ABC transport system permease protein
VKKLLQCFWKNRNANMSSLIIIMITVILSSTAVFGVMNALPLLKIALQNDMRKAAYGNSDFVVSAQENALFSEDEIRTKGKVAGVLDYYGIINDKKCDIVGANYSNIAEVFDIELESGKKLGTSTDGVVITKWLADKMNLNQGDKIDVAINHKEYSLTISAIAFNKGLFKDSTYLIMLKKAELDSILGTSESDINTAYIYGCDAKATTKDIKLLGDLKITKVVDEELINSEISMYGALMAFILIFVFFIAFYIIYNIYNIFVIERGKYVGTLRSCGATKRKIRNVFVATNAVITIIAGLIGVLLGGTVICVFAWEAMSINYIKTEFSNMVLAFGITMLFSLILGSISIILPLNNVLKFSERALLNGEIERNSKTGIMIPVLSFALTCFLWFFTSIKSTGNLLVECVIFIIFIASSILSIQFIILLMDKLVGKRIGKGAFLIALKNVIHNIYVQKNVTIIAILTILMILVGNLSYSIFKGMSSFYNNYKCNAYFETSVSFDENELNQLSKIKGVNKYFPCISKKVVINNTDEVSCFIENEPEKLSEEFLEFNIHWNNFHKEEFSKGKYCIITDVLAKRHNLKVRDYINISCQGVKEKYCIAAISYTTIEKGDFIFISKYDLPFKNCSNYNLILVDCKNISNFYDELEIAFPDRTIYFTSVQDKIKEDEGNSKGLIAMFSAFSIFVVLIGMQGIYNNFKLGYINRKKEFAIMMSSGYRFQDLFRILLIETTICSLLGGIISIIYMLFYRKEISNIMFLMDLAWPLLNNIWIILLPILLCIAASFVSIFITCRQMKKIEKNIINVLKI